jgi:hypothetical protein
VVGEVRQCNSHQRRHSKAPSTFAPIHLDIDPPLLLHSCIPGSQLHTTIYTHIYTQWQTTQTISSLTTFPRPSRPLVTLSQHNLSILNHPTDTSLSQAPVNLSSFSTALIAKTKATSSSLPQPSLPQKPRS